MKRFLFSSLAVILFCALACNINFLHAEFDNYNLYNPTEIIINDLDTEANITKIKYIDGSLYVVDNLNKKIFQINEQQNIIYSNEDAPFDIMTYDNNYLVATQQMFLQNISNQIITEINRYQNKEGTAESLPSPQTFTKSATGEIYLIQGSQILKFNTVDYSLNWFCDLTYELQNLTFNQGGFDITENGKTIYFTIEDQIYSLDTSQKTIFNVPTDQTFEQIKYIKVDNLGNIYILDGTTLTKIKQNTATDIYQFESAPTSIDIDFLTGTIYYANADQKIFSAKLTTQQQKNFVTDYSQILPTIDIVNISPSTDMYTGIEIQTATNLYNYQTLLSPITQYEVGKTLIVLDASLQDFYYVFDNNFDNEDGFTLGYVLKSDCTQLPNILPTEYAETNTAKVITGFSKIFAMPISQQVAPDTYISSIATLEYEDIVSIIASPQILQDKNGIKFVAIEYSIEDSSYIGYIDSKTIIPTTYEAPKVHSVPNAITRAETIVYQEKNCFNKIDVLTKGQEVKIINSLNGVSQIEYYVSDGEEKVLMTGYVKTSFLDDGSLTITQIVGIVLIVVSIIITIIIAVLGHRRRKKLAE